MKKKLQKVFALLLTFSMLMSMMSITAFATVGDNSQQIENWGGTKYYDANGKVVDGAQSLAGDAVVGLTKSIEATDTENYFDITLTVETEQKIEEIKKVASTDVVIVMDTSNTMQGDKLANAKTAAKSFLNSYANLAGAACRLGFVTFDRHATTEFGLTNVSGISTANKNTLSGKIDSVMTPGDSGESDTGWTNIEGGLQLAQNLLNASSARHKYVVLLTDGFPTTYVVENTRNNTSTVSGYSPNMSEADAPGGKHNLDNREDHDEIKANKDTDGYFYDVVADRMCAGADYSDKGAKKAQTVAKSIKDSGINIFTVGVGIGAMTIQYYVDLHAGKNFSTVQRDSTTYVIGNASDTASYKTWLGTKIGGGTALQATAAYDRTYGAYTDGGDGTNLTNVFENILNNIKTVNMQAVSGSWVGSDPMNATSGPTNIEFKGFYTKGGAFVPYSEEDGCSISGTNVEGGENTAVIEDSYDAISWDLKESGYVTSKISGNTTVYTYSITYRVRLANETNGFVEFGDYDTNGETTLKYRVITTDSAPVDHDVNFMVPKVEGYLGSFSFLKKDAYRPSVALTGAKFVLTHDADCSICGGTVDIIDKTSTSVPGGEVAFNDNIPSGHTYTLTETEVVPTGYLQNTAEYDVSVAYGRTIVTDSAGAEVYDSEDDSHNMVVTNELDPQPIRVTVNKTWVGHVDGAKGVTVTVDIYDSRDTEVVDEKTQPKSGAAPVDTVTITGNASVTSRELPSVDVETGETIAYVAIERADASYKQVGSSAGESAYEINLVNLMNKEKEITITKSWIAPDSYHDPVLVQIYQDNVKYGDPITVNGSATVKVPTYRENGTNEQYVYTVAEVDASGTILTQYTHKDKTFTATVDGMNITNTIAQEFTSVTGNKTWKIASWPEEDKTNVTATIILKADGTEIDRTTVTYPATTYSFGIETVETMDGETVVTTTRPTLPKYDLSGDGHEIMYTVEETYAGGDGIVGAQKGNDFTNTLTGTVSIEGTKTWDDEGESTRPATITINLLRNGTEIDEVVLKAKTTYENGDPIYGEVPAEGGKASIVGYEQVAVEPELSYKFLNLPKYDENGAEYTYTVTEDSVPNYATTKGATEYDFVNTLDGGEKTLTVSKVWNDAGVNHSEDTISFGVYIEQEGDDALYQTITLPTEEGAWTKTIPVELYDGGKTLNYYVRELDASGNPIEANGKYGENYTVSYANSGDAWTVTNTINQEKTSVSVEKKWNGGSDSHRPGVVVNLMNGQTQVSTITLPVVTTTTDPEGGAVTSTSWSYTFENLDKYAYDDKGVASIINYTVSEEMTGEAKLVARYEKRQTTANDAKNSYIITNNFDAGETSVSGSKTWIAGGYTAEVTVGLYADGVKKDSQTTVDGAFKFNNLPVYNADGSEIVYSIRELDAEGNPIAEGGIYDGKYTVNYSGYNITNKLSDLENTDVSVSVNKVWNGPIPQNGSVSFNVTRSSNETVDATWSNTITLSNSDAVAEGSNVWTGKLEGLAKYDAAGYPYTYSVSEAGVVEGKITVDGIEYTSAAEDANTFVNTVVDPNNVSLTVEKVWESSTDKNALPASVTLQLLADGVKVDEVTLPKANAAEGEEWKHTFENKPVYDATTYKEITYTVKEMNEQDGVIALHGNSQRYFVTYTSNDTGVTVTNTLKDVDAYYYKVHRYYKTVINGVTNEYYDNDTAYTETVPGQLDIDAMKWVDCATDEQGIIYTFLKDPTNVTQGNNGTYTFIVGDNGVVGFDVVKYAKADGEAPNYYYDVYLNYEYTYNDPYNPPPYIPPTSDNINVSVTKVWNDSDDAAGLRPDSITVQLLKDGAVEDEVVLSESNRWSKTWSDLSKDATWSVAEVNVPEGYTSKVTSSGRQFTITNTYSEEVIEEEEVPLDPAPDLEEIPEEEVPLAAVPKTGDAAALWLALSALSGTGLAGVTFLGRKKRED